MHMVPLISLLVVLVLSMLVVRVATVALTLTGLSQELARFQARSAFTGAGFTTTESEKVVHHPVRRRVIMLLMLLGNAGFITAISSLILSFVSTPDDGRGLSLWVKMSMLIAGLTALWMVAQSSWVDRHMSRLIKWALKRWTSVEARDYAGLLHLSGDYAVAELHVREGDWLAGRKLQDLRLADEGVVVLGIERTAGNYIGAPRGPTKPQSGDTLILYGPRATLVDLDERRADQAGNWDHHQAVDRQVKVERQEAEVDKPQDQAT